MALVIPLLTRVELGNLKKSDLRRVIPFQKWFEPFQIIQKHDLKSESSHWFELSHLWRFVKKGTKEKHIVTTQSCRKFTNYNGLKCLP